jgi:hypothetical protein
MAYVTITAPEGEIDGSTPFRPYGTYSLDRYLRKPGGAAAKLAAPRVECRIVFVDFEGQNVKRETCDLTSESDWEVPTNDPFTIAEPPTEDATIVALLYDGSALIHVATEPIRFTNARKKT